MKIQLMNVSKQYLEHEAEFNEVISKQLASGNYIGGAAVKEFENNFAEKIGAKFCVSCANGTDAIVLALRALNIGEGDEVITVAFTFFATAESIAAVGAKPVFVDIRKDTYCMDPDLIEEKITPRTKAILPVHIYGNCCDMEKINKIAKKHNLFVVEDCAQSTGSKINGKMTGTFGDIGCFSFFPTKILGCAGDGGAVVTNNPLLAKAARSFKMHGSGRDGYDVLSEQLKAKKGISSLNIEIADDKYHNYLIGYNSRLDAIQAVLLNAKLKYLDEYIERRQENANYYLNGLKGSKYLLPYVDKNVSHGFYVFAVACEDSADVASRLINNEIEVHTYYPVPLHLQGAFYDLGYKKGDLPVTEWMSKHSFAIPVYPEMSKEEMDFVISVLLEK